ncbi:MAG TPA: ABC transporter substrate-binding protein [Candidatus Binatia bacterium]|nr:ABC transporter substrate-binding protein [Candidatus Binatia bacterium]
MKEPLCRQNSLRNFVSAVSLFLILLLVIDSDLFAGPVEGNPRKGGTLILGMTADPSTLNCGIESSQIVAMVTSSIYSGLIHLDEESNPHPDLAQSWEISPDGLVYTFQLRENVKWHDGEPFTSADVKFSFENLVGKYNARGREAYRNIKAIETPGPLTVKINLKKAYSPFLGVLTAHDGCIMPKHVFDGTDVFKNPHNDANPVGSGPFKFKEWKKGSHVTLARNDNYFKKGRPFLDSVIFRIIPNAATRAIAFETGEINAIFASNSFPYQHVDRLKKLRNATIKDIGSPSLIGVHFNLKGNPIVAKKEVRMAIAHAIDKKFVVEKGLRGVGKVIDSVIPPGIPWAYNANVPKYPFDLNKANALLDEAGHPRGAGGMRFALRLAFEAGNDNAERPVQILREQLKAAGIDIKLERFERSVMLEKVFQKYDFDLWFGPLTTRGHPALGTARIYTSSSITGRPFTNFTRYSNPKVDHLFDLAVSATKKADMVKAYYEVQDILLRDLPTIPVADRLQLNIIKDQFKGALTSTETYERLDEIWWVQGTPLKEGDFERD